MLEMTRSRFEVLVDDAIDTIPSDLLALLDNVVIRVEDRHAGDPSLLGLYEGTSLTERTHEYTFALPDSITIYRLAILDVCTDEDEAAHEVAVTVVHEIGHHFGLDEERLHELGWG
jgi:predicted Zn-dependent protease with MMP-like domain